MTLQEKIEHDSALTDRIQQARRELSEAYSRLFSSADGKMVLDDLIEQSGLFKAGYSDDVTALSFNEGCRSTILYVLNRIEETTTGKLTLLRRAAAEAFNRRVERQGL